MRLLAALAALACAAPAPAADVVFWTSHQSKQEQEAIAKLVADYNARKGAAAPHVAMKLMPFDGFADKIAGVVPRGRGPDLFIYPQDRLGGWVEAGNVVAPIDALADAATRERFIPAALHALLYRGGLYGLPFSYKTITLYYNKKLVPVPPRTTAQLAAIARKLTNRRAGISGLAYLYSDYWYHAALQNGFGGRVFDAALSPVLDSPENVKALELLLSWKDFLPQEEPSHASMPELFSAGKAAMAFEGPWFAGEIGDAVDYGLAPLPAISEAQNAPMRPWMTVEGLYIAAPSKEKEAAYDFMRYATDVEAARVIALQGTLMPANQRAYLDPALAANDKLNAFFRQTGVAVAMPNLAEMTVMWSPVTLALGAALRGTETPRDALAKAQERVAKGVAQLHAPPRPPPR
jgi:arabinogalactan oligomer/maltooligosaccharide transport system substrate-binding protein